MVSQAEGKRFHALFLSMEDTVDEADFDQQLLRSISKHKSGSLGLDMVTGRHRLSDSINDRKITGLGAFSRESATALLQMPAASYQVPLSGEVVEQILNRLEWLLPYYLQLVFAELLDTSDHREGPADVPMIDKLFEGLLQPATNG